MTIARVTAADGVGTTSAAFGATPTAGHLLLCAVTSNTGGTPTITGWTQIGASATFGFSYVVRLFAKNAAGTEGTITPTANSATIYATEVCEYSGTPNPYVLDGTAAGSIGNFTTSCATAAITTTDAGSLIITAGATSSTTSPGTWTTATGILANNQNPGASNLGQYLPGTTKTSYTDTYTYGGSTSGGTIIAGFKPYLPPQTITTTGKAITVNAGSVGPISIHPIGKAIVVHVGVLEAHLPQTITATGKAITVHAGTPQFPDPLKTITDALAACATTAVNIMTFGDSITEGAGPASNYIDARYISYLGYLLQTRFLADGGLGYVNVYSGTGVNGPSSGSCYWEWSPAGPTGAASLRAPGGRITTDPAVGTGVSLTYVGTSFKLLYKQGTSDCQPFTVNTNFLGAVTVTPATTGGARYDGVYQSPVQAHGTYLAAITPSSGNAIRPAGAVIYDGDETGGIHVFEHGYYGIDSTQELQGGAPHPGTVEGLTDILSVNMCVDPALVIIFLGLNDGNHGISAATYKTNIQSIIDNVKSLCTRSPSFVLVGPYNTTYGGNMDAYYGKLQEIAAADQFNVRAFSLNVGFPDTGDISGDNLHPTSQGHAHIAALIAPIFPSAGVTVTTTGKAIVVNAGSATLSQGLRPTPTGKAIVVNVGSATLHATNTLVATGKAISVNAGAATLHATNTVAATGKAIGITAGTVVLHATNAVAVAGKAIVVNAGALTAVPGGATRTIAGKAIGVNAGTVVLAVGGVTRSVAGKAVAVNAGTVALAASTTRVITGVAIGTHAGTVTLIPGGVTRATTGKAIIAVAGAVTLVNGAVAIVAAGKAVPVAVGAVALAAGQVTVAPSGKAIPVAVGAPTLHSAITVAVSGKAVPVVAGTVTLATGAVAAVVIGRAIAVNAGSPTLHATYAIVPAGKPIVVNAGAAALAVGPVTVATAGNAILVVAGSVTVQRSGAIAPAGKATSVVAGAPTLHLGPVTATATGKAVPVVAGAVILHATAVRVVAGVAVSAHAGIPTLRPGPVTLAASGHAVSVNVGAPTLHAARTVAVAGVAISVHIGASRAYPAAQQITTVGVAVLAAAGGVHLATVTAHPIGVPVAVVGGAPTLAVGALTVHVGGFAIQVRAGTARLWYGEIPTFEAQFPQVRVMQVPYATFVEV